MMNFEEEHAEGGRPAQRRAVTHGGSKVTRERVGLLVLSVLLAAAAIVIYRLFFEFLRAEDQLQTLTEENRALRRNFTAASAPMFPSAFHNFQNKSELQTLRDECSALRDELTCIKERTEKPTKGWELHGGRCYYFSVAHYSWEESRCLRQSEGGDLVKVDSSDKQRFLVYKVRDLMQYHEDLFWIGLTDTKEEGTWVWMDGSPLNGRLTFWAAGEPDDWKEESWDGEDCVRLPRLVASDDLKCWLDKACQVPQRYICEKAAQDGGSRCP